MNIKCLLLVISMSTLWACVSIDAKTRSLPMKDQPVQRPATEYRLKPTDRLSLIFMASAKQEGEDRYRLGRGDEIGLRVHEREDLNGVFKVFPDGWVQFPLLEAIKVQGMTLDALRAFLTKEYQLFVVSPQIVLVLNQHNSSVLSFIHMLSQSNGQGPVYETTLGLDGFAVFPQIGEVHLAEKSLKEANTILADAYNALLPGLDVTARLVGSRDNVVTVLGEVKRPGAFEVFGSVSLIAALGLSEGWSSTAHLASILVVQQRNGQFFVNSYDLKKDMVLATQIRLSGGDMVFVPRSAISDVNVFIDQFIRRNIPINIGVGIPIN